MNVMMIFLLVLLFNIAFIDTHMFAEENEDANTTYDYELILRKKLLHKYNVHVLPKREKNSPIRVDIRLAIASIQELNEKSERLTVETFVRLVWNDSRLTWNSEDYGGIKSVRFPDHMIWQPDIKLFNSAKASEIDPWGHVYTLVYNTGNVRWLPPATFHSICNVDLRLYPYDVQNCYLKFGSWTLDGTLVDVSLYNNETTVDFADAYNENNQWEIIGSKSSKKIRYYASGEEPYPEVIYELQLRRRALYYKFTTLYPALAVVALILASFWLPPASTERITIGGISLMVLVILLIHLSWKLPPTGKFVPMIVCFCGNCVIVTTASIILSMVSICFSRARHNRPGPRFLKIIVNSWVGRILLVNPTVVIHMGKRGEPNNLEVEIDDLRIRPSGFSKEKYFVQDWMQCLQVFDRICFIIFCVVFAFVLGSSFDH